MSTNHKIYKLGTALLCVWAGSAYATNGYFAHGYGMKAKGMGGASVALAQDAFAGANNPAAAAFAGNRYDVGVDLFMPDRGMERSFGGAPIASAVSGRDKFLVPEFGYNVGLSDKLGVGLTVYGNGGMNTTYNTNVLNGTGKLGVDLMQLIVAPTVAYKVADGHALGVSPLLVYQRFEAYGLGGFASLSSNAGLLTNNGKDGSTGFGVRLGYLGRLNDTLSIGASYSPKIKMSRLDSYAGLFAGAGGFDIPENYTLGVAVNVSPDVQVALDYQRIHYSGVPSIANPSSNAAPLGAPHGPGFGWSDVGVIKLGVQWKINQTWTMRAGINKGQNPVNPNNVSFNILAPGVVTDHITLGGTMQLDAASELTFSYMHARNQTVSGVSMFDAVAFGGPGNGSIRETVRMKQNAIGIQYSRKF